MTTAAPPHESGNTTEATLFVAFALREQTWQRGVTTGHGPQPRERPVTARHHARLLDDIAQAQRRVGRLATAPVVSCAAAGRDGFWLHRFFQAHGSTNQVVDASAIEVNRRRAKSDGWDMRTLLRRLRRYAPGERQGWPGVQGPSVAAEDHRPRPRDVATRQQERARTTPRLPGVRRSQGIRLTSLSTLPEPREARRRWEGSPLPPGRRRRVRRV
jgi:hypothetical protein